MVHSLCAHLTRDTVMVFNRMATCFRCRRTSAATTHAVLSDDEEEELLSGDSLWEDEQASKVSVTPSIYTRLAVAAQHQHNRFLRI